MATSRYLQPRQPGGTTNSAQEDDPNGVYIPGRRGRIDARPRNVLYLPGTGPGTGRTGIRTGIINRDGSTSALSPMGYRTGPLADARPSSLDAFKKSQGVAAADADAGAPATRSLTTSAASTRAQTSHFNADTSDEDTDHEDDAGDAGNESANAGSENSGASNPGGPAVAEPISLDNPSGSLIHPGGASAPAPISLDNPSGSLIHPGGASVPAPISLDNPSGSFIHPGSNEQPGGPAVAEPISLDNPTGSLIHPGGVSVPAPISLDNPTGSFIHPGAAQTNPSGSSEESGNHGGGGGDGGSEGEQPSSEGEGLYRPYTSGRKGRIDARPKNVIYQPGTGPGTGRTAIRIGVINRDGSTSALSSPGGYRTGPLSDPRPSSLPPKPAAGAATATTPAAPPAAAPPSTTATPGMDGTLKASTAQFGSDPAQQKLQAPKPLTAPVIASSVSLPSDSKPKTAANAVNSGVDGTLKASTQPFGTAPAAPKPPAEPAATPKPPATPATAAAPKAPAAPAPAPGSSTSLDTKAPAISLAPTLGGGSKSSSGGGLDTLGASSKPFGDSSMKGPLDLSGVKKRAMGGPVRAGQPYLVGERGPELIIPRHSGTVVPNHVLKAEALTEGRLLRPRPAPAEYARHHARRGKARGKAKARGDDGGQRKANQQR